MNDQDIIKKSSEERRQPKHGWKGVIFLLVGVFLLLQTLNLDIPRWIVSWEMLLIGIGLVIGLKHNFRGVAWLILILVGAVFLSKEIFLWPFDMSRFIWPAIFIIIGLLMIFKRHHWDKAWPDTTRRVPLDTTTDDYLDSSVIFSGENRAVLSKQFKGGKVTAIFGGSDINFSQADFEGRIAVDVTAIFGGVELIVPSNWDVKVELTSVFGGVEDKRPIGMLSLSPNKTLVITGSCIFGGVEIKSFA